MLITMVQSRKNNLKKQIHEGLTSQVNHHDCKIYRILWEKPSPNTIWKDHILHGVDCFSPSGAIWRVNLSSLSWPFLDKSSHSFYHRERLVRLTREYFKRLWRRIHGWWILVGNCVCFAWSATCLEFATKLCVCHWLILRWFFFPLMLFWHKIP